MYDLLMEFLGTFVFLTVVLTAGEAIPIGLTLAAVIFFCSKISFAHINPAISVMMFAKGALSLEKFVGYVIAQVLGGLVALMLYNQTVAKKLFARK